MGKIARQHKLLRELEDARRVVKNYKTGWNIITVVAVLSGLFLVLGTIFAVFGSILSFDVTGGLVAFYVMGGVGAIACFIGSCVWYLIHNHEVQDDHIYKKNERTLRTPQYELRVAEDAYNEYLDEEEERNTRVR